MDWNKTNVSKDEYYHLLAMQTIKNDVSTLYNLAPYISSKPQRQGEELKALDKLHDKSHRVSIPCGLFWFY